VPLQPLVSDGIFPLPEHMEIAIDLDANLGPAAEEVKDIRSHRMLTPEVESDRFPP